MHNNSVNMAIKLMSESKYYESLFVLSTLKNTPTDILQILFYEGLNHLRLGNLTLAITKFEQAMNIVTNFEITFNLAVCYFQIKDYYKAVELFKKAKNLNPNYYEINVNIADSYMNICEFKTSIIFYDQMLNNIPNNSIALINKGICLKKLGKFKASLKCYNKILKLDSNNYDAHWNKGLVLLTLGKLQNGFKEFEYRLLATNQQINQKVIPADIPKYNGEELKDKTIVVFPEQGFGDNIQMFRYLYLLSKLAKIVYYVSYPELYELFSTDNKIRVIRYSDLKNISPIDYYTTILSLPMLLKTKKTNIPSPHKLNIPNKIFYNHNQQRLQIGISWQGEKNHQDDSNRSINIALIKELINKFPKCHFYLLQLNEDISTLNILPNFIDCSGAMTTFFDTAQIIQNLDLVITIDTAVAHLAATLGKPTWILLPYIPDWRWGLKTKNTKWYPSTKLYRQKEYRNWEAVLKKVISDLKKLHFQYDLSMQIGQKRQI